jgi:hypothetical protein
MIFLNQLYQYIQTFDSSTLYTTSPREHFKTLLKEKSFTTHFTLKWYDIIHKLHYSISQRHHLLNTKLLIKKILHCWNNSKVKYQTARKRQNLFP